MKNIQRAIRLIDDLQADFATAAAVKKPRNTLAGWVSLSRSFDYAMDTLYSNALKSMKFSIEQGGVSLTDRDFVEKLAQLLEEQAVVCRRPKGLLRRPRIQRADEVEKFAVRLRALQQELAKPSR